MRAPFTEHREEQTMHLHFVRDAARPQPRPAKVVQLDVRRQARLEEKARPRPLFRPAA
jgi:hypothetical protein